MKDDNWYRPTDQLALDVIAPPHNREEALFRAARTLPDGDDELIEAMRKTLVEYDKARRHNDTDQLQALEMQAEAIAIKLNGGTSFGMATPSGSYAKLQKALAVDNKAPLWGQPGRFVVETGGFRSLIEYHGMFSTGMHTTLARAIDWELPWLNASGVMSLHAYSGMGMGMSVEDWATSRIESQLRTMHQYSRRKKSSPLVAIDPDYRKPPSLDAVWVCPGCNEENDADNDECWNCDRQQPKYPPRGIDPAWKPGGWIYQLQQVPPLGMKPKRVRRGARR